jgi:hypothetical protein
MFESETWFVVRQYFVAIPSLLVCFVGLIVALVFIKKYFWSAILSGVAMCILLFLILAMPLALSWLLHSRIEAGWTNMTYGQIVGGVEVVAGLGRALAVLLLLIAVFIGRKQPKTSNVPS